MLGITIIINMIVNGYAMTRSVKIYYLNPLFALQLNLLRGYQFQYTNKKSLRITSVRIFYLY